MGRSVSLWPRCLLAILLMVGLGTGLVEELFPESHDGDAAASVLTRGQAGPIQNLSASLPHSPDVPHACHCLHVHLMMKAEPESTDFLVVNDPPAAPEAKSFFPSITIPLPVRPPIA